MRGPTRSRTRRHIRPVRRRPYIAGLTTLILNNAEAGTNGTTVTAANSEGPGQVAFDAVQTGASATTLYDNAQAAHGSLSFKIATGATSTTSYVEWGAALPTGATRWFRQYLYITANPAAQHRILNVLSGASQVGNVLLKTNGALIFTNSSGTTVLTSAAVPQNQWVRLEGFVTGSATVGQWEYKIWYSPDSTGTPDDTQTSAASQSMTGTPNVTRFGVGSNVASVTAFWMDDLGLSTTGYIGPAGAGTTPVSATRGTTWDTLASVTPTRGTTWDVLASVTPTRGTTWDTLSAVTPTRATTWDTLAKVSLASRATTWDALAAVSQTRATTWDVASALTSVSATRATTWDVAAVVSQTRATSWDVLTVVSPASRGTTWDVLVPVSLASRATTWNTYAAITSTRATTWDVLFAGTVSVSATRATTWGTLAIVSGSRLTTWKVYPTVTAPDLLDLVGSLSLDSLTGQLTFDALGGAVDLDDMAGSLDG